MLNLNPTTEREIRYDRETRDYALYLDGRCVGYAGSYSAGEVKLDALIYDSLTHGDPPPEDAPGHDEDGVPHALVNWNS